MKDTSNKHLHRSAGQFVCIAVAGCILSGSLNVSDLDVRISSDMKQDSNKQTTPAVVVKKEVYATSPEPGVGVSISMYYVGRGCRREEIRSLVRTSDLSDTSQRRRSDDDRNPAEDSEFLQLSNFSVVEDCRTYSIEIYLTKLGQRGEGRDLWSADAYKYTISISK